MATIKKRKQTESKRQQSSIDPSFKLRSILPMTDGQKDVIEAYDEGHNLFLYGVAGTGKTFMSLYLALRDVMACKKNYHRVYIVRSSVPSRDMGFMPGTLQEKMEVYEAPYRAMINKLFSRDDAWQIITAKGAVQLISTSYLRGITLENCVVIFDETQNASFQEMDTVVTRIGDNCRIVLCGDIEQCDLLRKKNDITGFPAFAEIIKSMEEFRSVEFDIDAIVRSGIVKSYILAKRRYQLSQHLPTFV